MKFSEQWLREWVNPTVNSQELADQLTMLGLQVDSVQPVAPEFKGVYIGQILNVYPHPQAQRLNCCEVSLGGRETIKLVCGGINVRPNLKVAVATAGANLPGNVHIEHTTIRGVASNGMICSIKELGLGEADRPGIIWELPENAPLGVDLNDYLQLNDNIIDIELTANRGDCLSLQGLAREISAAYKLPLQAVKIENIIPQNEDIFPVVLSAPKSCPCYMGRIIRGINPQAATPMWMQEKLRRSGVRSLQLIVDICNYVMLELGQPMHAFDFSKLHNSIEVRLAQDNESITLLDGQKIELLKDTLVIADEKQPQAIAGIMGGLDSAVTSITADIFLESAFFDPIQLSLTARRYFMQTDASYRFARGVDFNLQRLAIERATALILELSGGFAGPVIEQVDRAYLPEQPILFLRRQQIVRLLGVDLPDQQIENILESLGMNHSLQADGWAVNVPSYRFDVRLEVDLIEEIARMVGYDQLPSLQMQTPLQVPELSENKLPLTRITNFLVDRDYYEVITYSFVDRQKQHWLDPERSPLALSNPLATEMAIMRTNLWPGLLQAVEYNQHRQIPRVRLFETGLCFYSDDGATSAPVLTDEKFFVGMSTKIANQQWLQIPMLAGVISGDVNPEQWGMTARSADFFDLKGDVEALLSLSNCPLEQFNWRASQHPALHPGQSAEIFWSNGTQEYWVGRMGSLHPKVLRLFDLDQPILVFELKLSFITSSQLPQFQEISKFPSIRRDIALTLSQDIPASTIKQFILKNSDQLLQNVHIFDVYQGAGIEKGKKSIALGLTFQEPSRTLIDEEVNAIQDRIVQLLKQHFSANLRT